MAMDSKEHDKLSFHSELVAVPESGEEIAAWLAKYAPADARWLLAHAYDGVVWGRQDNGTWRFSSGCIANSPELQVAKLLQLRVFGPHSELFLWRDSAGLHGRIITDGAGETTHFLDEPQILWGNKRGPRVHDCEGFTPLADGDQGNIHAVPLKIPNERLGDNNTDRPVRLWLRHYITQDEETGLARIRDSRLLHLEVLPDPKEKDNGRQA